MKTPAARDLLKIIFSGVTIAGQFFKKITERPSTSVWDEGFKAKIPSDRSSEERFKLPKFIEEN